jgi:hypothetical protein
VGWGMEGLANGVTIGYVHNGSPRYQSQQPDRSTLTLTHRVCTQRTRGDKGRVAVSSAVAYLAVCSVRGRPCVRFSSRSRVDIRRARGISHAPGSVGIGRAGEGANERACVRACVRTRARAKWKRKSRPEEGLFSPLSRPPLNTTSMICSPRAAPRLLTVFDAQAIRGVKPIRKYGRKDAFCINKTSRPCRL